MSLNQLLATIATHVDFLHTSVIVLQVSKCNRFHPVQVLKRADISLLMDNV